MNGRQVTLAAVCLAALVLVGCGHTTSLSDLPDRELVGHYVGGEGQSWFRACGAEAADPSWWVTFTDGSVADAEAARAAGRLEPGASYFVRLRAAVTTGGEVGPHGPGVPALLVRELLELRPATAGDCFGVAPTD